LTKTSWSAVEEVASGGLLVTGFGCMSLPVTFLPGGYLRSAPLSVDRQGDLFA
jgi:hypothetical protein